jgi:TonB-dependent receptor
MTSTSLRIAAVFLLASLVATGQALPAAAQDAVGFVDGTVTDVTTGEFLPGARVVVQNTNAETATDRNGHFHLSVSAGPQTLTISYLGRKDQLVTVDVTPSATKRVEVQLGLAEYKESVTVTAGLIADAQGRALNQQRTAPNITNVVSADQIGAFPDRNAAETTQRIPGISITKDQGEGRYVSVRGTEPRLNAIMIDGQRVPSPDPLIRQVAVDVVPSELLESIEVSKALTPDQDADSIGGSVNLVMKSAAQKPQLFGAIGGGYNAMLSDWAQSNLSLTGGRRFMGGRAGALVSFSSSETNRGNQDVEVVYTPALTLNELNPRWYQVNRRRVGMTGAFDVRQGNNAAMKLRAVFNRFIDDHENRQRVRYAVGNSRIDRELRDRTHIERIGSLSLSGDVLAGQAAIEYQVLGAYSDQFDPLTTTTVFRQSRVTFAPNVTSTSIDPDNVQANPTNEDVTAYNFQSQLRATNFAKDRDVVGSVSARMPIGASRSAPTFLKVGGKFRDKQKGRNRNESTYTTPSTLKMTGFLESGFDLPPYLDGRYNLEPYVSQSLVSSIPGTVTGTLTRNHARDAEEFDGTERVAAAFGMAEIYAGSKLYLLPGVRYEYTSDDFTGRDVLFAPTGAWAGTSPLGSAANYGVVLPALHVRYAITPDVNIRAAVTRSLARPNYYDAVPYRSQNDTDLTVALGNADLSPTKAWNVDLLAERYFRSVGSVSAGYFYKRLDDYVFAFTGQTFIGGSQYQVTQPLNGDVASVQGLEVAFQNQLRFLPAPFDGLGLYANYTFTDSTSQLPNHVGDSPLPGQSKHLGNVAVSYEKGGFTGRMALNFHGSYIDVVGATAAQDRYYDRNSQLDLSMQQRLTRRVRVYVDLLNLNDALLRYYQGTPERVLQEEHYRWAANFGLKFQF